MVSYSAENVLAGNTTPFRAIGSGKLLSLGDNYVKGNGDDGGAISLVWGT